MPEIFFENKRWFVETPFPGIRRCKRDLFFIEKEIVRKKTNFQDVFIFSTPGFGRILALDGIIQFSQLDEFIYHETMAHTSLFTHPFPKIILIIGGGDGGVLREVCKHKDLERIHLVEIDKEIPEICSKYLSFVSQSSFEDKRVKIFYEDGAKFVKDKSFFYDVIMVDSTDPVGPGKVLFRFKFYKSIYTALKEDGLAIFQAGPFLDLKTTIKDSFKNLKRLFKYVNLISLPMPSYSCGCEYCFIIASKEYNPLKVSLRQLKLRYNSRLKKPVSLRYYNPTIHLASMTVSSIWQI